MNTSGARDKYSYVVALLAVILAFAAFKDELSKATISFGLFDATVLQIGIAFVLILSLSTYLFALTYSFQGSKLEGSRLLGGAAKTADVVYFIGMAVPIILFITWVLNLFIGVLAQFLGAVDAAELLQAVTTASSLLLGFLTGVYSKRYAHYKGRLKDLEIFQSFVTQKDLGLENAERLYKQKFYASSIIEAYKAIELSIRSWLAKNKIPVPYDVYGLELIQLAQTNEVVGPALAKQLDRVRKLRNQAAHLDKGIEKADADYVMDVTSTLIRTINDSLSDDA